MHANFFVIYKSGCVLQIYLHIMKLGKAIVNLLFTNNEVQRRVKSLFINHGISGHEHNSMIYIS